MFGFIMPNFAQPQTDVENMTRDEVLEMKYEELIDLPLDKLLKLAGIVGVSLDELYEMILNPDIKLASKQREQSFEAPLSTSVVTRDQIEKAGINTIEEIFRLVPGMIVREQTSGYYDIHIRGNDYITCGNNPEHIYTVNTVTLVMIDNQIVYNSFQGGTMWENLPIDVCDIERVEIVRGPSSALYGPNAVSGVIHFVTNRENKKGLYTKADIRGGTHNFLKTYGSARYNMNKKLSVEISGNYHHIDRFQEKYYFDKDGEDYKLINIQEFLDTLPPRHRDKIKEFFPDDNFGKIAQNRHVNIEFTPKKDIKFQLSGTIATTEMQGFFIGAFSPMTIRESENTYINFNSKIKNFSYHFSMITGTQNYSKNYPGFKHDFTTYNTYLEYDFKWKKLSIRPGVSYSYMNYNDAPYTLPEPDFNTVGKRFRYNSGFLGGEKENNSSSYYIRADYLLWNKLRLAGAFRQDFYKAPSDIRPISYQAIVSYKIDKNNLVRFVFSGANRSPFMVDAFADFYEKEMDDGFTRRINVKGNENLELMKTQMYELGFRNKLLKNLFVDFEVFFSQNSDYSLIDAKGLRYNEDYTGVIVDMQYENMKMKSRQFGVTGDINVALGKKFKLQLFATLQQTFISDYKIVDPDFFEAITGVKPADNTVNIDNPAYIDIRHKWTPSFYGGAILNYSPTDKLNILLNAYHFSQQQFLNQDGKYKIIKEKHILNTHIKYSINKYFNIFGGIKNILNITSEEIYLGDKTSRLFYGGIDFNINLLTK